MRRPLQRHNLTDREARSSLHTNLPFRLIGLDLRAHLDLEMSANCKRTSHYSPASFSNWPIGDFVSAGSVNTDSALYLPQTPREVERSRFWTYFSFQSGQGVKYHFHFFAGFQFQPPVRHFLVKPGPTSVATFFFFFLHSQKLSFSLPLHLQPLPPRLVEIVISKVFPLQTAIGSVLQAAAT